MSDRVLARSTVMGGVQNVAVEVESRPDAIVDVVNGVPIVLKSVC